jgi:hypothetical protein
MAFFGSFYYIYSYSFNCDKVRCDQNQLNYLKNKVL